MRNLVKDGGDDNQAPASVRQSRTRPRATRRAPIIFTPALADYIFWKPATRISEASRSREIWTNAITKKMYITGGCGALYDGASPDGSRAGAHPRASILRAQLSTAQHDRLQRDLREYRQRFLELAHAARHRRRAVHGCGRLALYNSVLSGGALDGTNFFYTNPLRVTDPMPATLRWSRQREPFVGSFCCPPISCARSPNPPITPMANRRIPSG